MILFQYMRLEKKVAQFFNYRNKTSSRINTKNRGTNLSYMLGNILKSYYNTMWPFIL